MLGDVAGVDRDLLDRADDGIATQPTDRAEIIKEVLMMVY